MQRLLTAALAANLLGATLCAEIRYPLHVASQLNAFTVATASSGTGAWSDAPGVGGAAGLVEVAVSGAQTRTYYQATPLLIDGQGVTVACFFRGAAFTTTAVTRLAVGLSIDTTSNLNTDTAPVQGRLVKNGGTAGTLEVRDAAPAGAIETTGVLLMTGRWYKLSATFVAQPEAQAFEVTTRLEDYGVTGAVAHPTLLATARGTRTGAGAFFTGDQPKPVYAGWLLQNDGGGATAFDQVSFSQGPPASLAFASRFTSAKRGHFFTPGEPLAFSLALSGPVELSRDVLVSLIDARGQTVATTTATLPAGPRRPVVVPLSFPAVAAGFYRLRATARDECLAETTLGVVPAAAAMAPDPSRRIGTIAHLKNLDDAERDAMLDLIGRAGFGWIREGFLWHQLEPQAGAWNWTRYDDLVERATAHGIAVLPVLAFTAEWASTAPAGTAVADARQWLPRADAWTGYVTQVVNRYAGRVTAWEVWNEPNLSSFWKPAPAASDYAALLAATYESIKEIAPQAVVISAGLAPETASNPTATTTHEATFAAAMQAQGSPFDAVGFHPYTVAGHTVTAAQHEARFDTTLDNLVKGFSTPPAALWFTELGVSSLPRIVSEEAAADYVAIMLTKAAAAPGMAKAFCYNFRDAGTDPEEKEHQFGLLHYDYTPKPGYFAVRAFVGKTGGTAFAARSQVGGATLHEFRVGTRRVLVLWADANPVDVTLPLDTAAVTVSHVTGAPLPASFHGGVLSLRATSSPVYIEYDID